MVPDFTARDMSLGIGGSLSARVSTDMVPSGSRIAIRTSNAPSIRLNASVVLLNIPDPSILGRREIAVTRICSR